ncbi:unnamed protein product [Angiostrongylus costaricensis]|uniref:Uncharacterized protein n=1 Tax=Angiostrongylus costaricensis TaxID=334426 RepID=A0A158PL14_ANGCS|nr:unnamed protein product [Angiostrongylus costaricensis]
MSVFLIFVSCNAICGLNCVKIGVCGEFSGVIRA